MPMERDRYPSNWNEIAFKVKEAANWHCVDCDRPCRRPDESLAEFIERCEHPDLFEDEETEEFGVIPVPKPGRFVLTVAHLDQNPQNNDPANLKALCSGCHLKFDAPFRQANAHGKRERRGQLSIFLKPEPAGQGKDPTRIQPPLPLEELI